MRPLSSSSSVLKTASDSACVTSKPSERIARQNSLRSTVCELSSSHLRKRSTTRSDERASASRSDHVMNSCMSTELSPSVLRAAKRLSSSSSVCSPSSRSRIKVENSARSRRRSWLASAASKSAALLRLPASNISSPSPATSVASAWSSSLICSATSRSEDVERTQRGKWLREVYACKMQPLGGASFLCLVTAAASRLLASHGASSCSTATSEHCRMSVDRYLASIDWLCYRFQKFDPKLAATCIA